MARSFVHLVNPVAFPPGHALLRAQAVTFESMIRARDASPDLNVTLMAAAYDEDVPAIPEGFVRGPALVRSIQDVGAFDGRRKLPLIADLLRVAYEGSEAEALIFTNVDIALQPHFYSAVDALLSAGGPCLSITRRTVDDPPEERPDLAALYRQEGRPHPGHDCFVFPRAWVPELVLGHVAVGVPWIGRALLANLGVMDPRLRVIGDAHLTFHLGDDRAWSRPADRPYRRHNMREARRSLANLSRRPGALSNPHLRVAAAKWLSAQLTGELRYLAARIGR